LEQRPDPLWRERTGYSRRGALTILLVVLVAVYGAAIVIRPPGSCSFPGAGPCGAGDSIVASVKPISALSRSACVSEWRRWHGEVEARAACDEGRGRAWFRAVITNTGSDPTAVLCDVDAYRASGKRIATGVPVPVWIVQDPGVMWLKGHQRQVVKWFFDPHDAPANIGEADRFVATCRRNPSPPI
jgi:hypothetical protein